MIEQGLEGYLSPADLERWRHVKANVCALDDNPEAHNLRESREVWYDYFVAMGSFIVDYRLDVKKEIVISPETGAIYYEDEVELELEGE